MIDPLDRYSPLWGMALTTLCFTLAFVAARTIPFYQRETTRLAVSRHGYLDGLRGFLADGLSLFRHAHTWREIDDEPMEFRRQTM